MTREICAGAAQQAALRRQSRPMKRVAIVQSNYIPWKGYFDMIAAVDEFILYDDVQFTKNDWRNRNKIKTPQGTQWLSIPVGQDIRRLIREVVPEPGWQVKHWKTLVANYRRAPYFDEVSAWLEPLYLSRKFENLSQLNRAYIEGVCTYLGVGTRLRNSWDFEIQHGRTERLVDLCLQSGATEYVSGPAARAYLDESLFGAHGIDVRWFDYAGYPEYPQLWGGFDHAVSILDLLFNCGTSAPRFMKWINA